jgi:poly-beta-1,6-N-acetyl-D-glucosamine synthase
MDQILVNIRTYSPGMILFWALSGALLIQIFYHLFFFIRLAFHKKKAVSTELPPVSIIICARNEDDNLVANMPVILSQDYPDYEVVVVNDCSFDNTGDVLEEFAQKHKHLRIVTIKEDEYYQHGKKVAVMMGIKGSKHEHLVLTDADCKPTSIYWLRSMAEHFQEKTEIILGYGPYERSKGFLNKLIRYDAFFIAQQYLSYSLAGFTYMGVGRNLAYTKPLFFKTKGFASHYHLPSGDDDLFVNEAARKGNTKIEISADTFCYSKAKSNFRDWWWQKKRHLQTGNRYRKSHKFLLGLYVLSQWIFFGAFITTLVLQFQPLVVCGLFLFRFLIQMLTFNFTMKRLGERDLLILTPFFEIFFLLFYPIITISRIFQRKPKWN